VGVEEVVEGKEEEEEEEEEDVDKDGEEGEDGDWVPPWEDDPGSEGEFMGVLEALYQSPEQESGGEQGEEEQDQSEREQQAAEQGQQGDEQGQGQQEEEEQGQREQEEEEGQEQDQGQQEEEEQELEQGQVTEEQEQQEDGQGQGQGQQEEEEAQEAQGQEQEQGQGGSKESESDSEPSEEETLWGPEQEEAQLKTLADGFNRQIYFREKPTCLDENLVGCHVVVVFDEKTPGDAALLMTGKIVKFYPRGAKKNRKLNFEMKFSADRGGRRDKQLKLQRYTRKLVKTNDWVIVELQRSRKRRKRS
jgi:hypothetical protein